MTAQAVKTFTKCLYRPKEAATSRVGGVGRSWTACALGNSFGLLRAAGENLAAPALVTNALHRGLRGLNIGCEGSKKGTAVGFEWMEYILLLPCLPLQLLLTSRWGAVKAAASCQPDDELDEPAR